VNGSGFAREIDKSILQLAEKLDAWLDGLLPMLDSHDVEAQSKALLNAIEIANEFDRLKADGLAAIAALLDRQEAGTKEEQVASLIQSFALSAKLWRALMEMEPDGASEAGRLMHAIVTKLDGLETGRNSLVALLDDPDDMVRTYAGQYLIAFFPERVVPMLRSIYEKHDGLEPTMTASMVLFAWEQKQKERKSNNE
jgi:hypothetical protein